MMRLLVLQVWDSSKLASASCSQARAASAPKRAWPAGWSGLVLWVAFLSISVSTCDCDVEIRGTILSTGVGRTGDVA